MHIHLSQLLSHPVTLQCTYAHKNQDAEFASLLELLASYGFYGIELNLPSPEDVSFKRIHQLLEQYDLKMTYIATGAYAKQRGHSLSAPESMLRRQSIRGCMENIRIAHEFQAGIIIGFLKNIPTLSDGNDTAYLTDSLMQLVSSAVNYRVPILLEATNRYESKAANSLEDTMQIIRTINSDHLYLLPDSYHMNIEESNPHKALTDFLLFYPNIHLSDNNRYLPGFGCIAFGQYLKTLNRIGYRGTLGIEGMFHDSPEKDLERVAEYFKKVCEMTI